MNVTPFLKMLNILKVMHWATKSHAAHVALDAAYSELGDKIDEFVENYVGHTLNDEIICSPISFKIPQEGEELEYFNNNYRAFLKAIAAQYDSSSGLGSLIDDMENIGNKLLYLLRLN